MQHTGVHQVRAHREDVWAVLLDPATPPRLLPGSGTAEVGPGGLVAHVTLRQGPVAQDCEVVVETRVVPGGHRLEATVATRGALGRCEARVALRLRGGAAGSCELEHLVDVRTTGLLRWWGRRALLHSVEAHVEEAVERLRGLLPVTAPVRAPVTAPVTAPVLPSPVPSVVHGDDHCVAA